jgi:hypothetical protein
MRRILRLKGYFMHLDLWHGTNQEFDTFDEKMLGLHTSNPASEAAFFFAEKQETAILYAHGAARKLLPNQEEHEQLITEMIEAATAAARRGNNDEYERLILEAEEIDLGAIRADPIGGRVLRCRVNFDNPLEICASNHDVIVDLGKVLRDARAAGYDALILKDIVDTPSGEGPVDNHIAVFSSDQIEILDVIHQQDFPTFEEVEDEMAMAM